MKMFFLNKRFHYNSSFLSSFYIPVIHLIKSRWRIYNVSVVEFLPLIKNIKNFIIYFPLTIGLTNLTRVLRHPMAGCKVRRMTKKILILFFTMPSHWTVIQDFEKERQLCWGNCEKSQVKTPLKAHERGFVSSG